MSQNRHASTSDAPSLFYSSSVAAARPERDHAINEGSSGWASTGQATVAEDLKYAERTAI